MVPDAVQLINMEALRGMCRRMDYNDGGCKWLSWELGLTTFTKCLADTGAHFIDARDAYNRMLLLPQSLSVLLGTNWSSSSYSSNYLQTVDSVSEVEGAQRPKSLLLISSIACRVVTVAQNFHWRG